MNVRRFDTRSHREGLGTADAPCGERTILTDQEFRRMIAVERKRSERSGKCFLLMLVDIADEMPVRHTGTVLDRIVVSLTSSTRETDVIGWYEGRRVVGVMFTEICPEDRQANVDGLMGRVVDSLRGKLTAAQFDYINLSFHLYPDEWNHDGDSPSNPKLYADVVDRERTRKPLRIIKRAMDIAGSLFVLLCLSPVLLAIAIAVKCTSKGPVFFRQRRIGEFGNPFWMLKFRSMSANNDSTSHKQYAEQWIAGVASRNVGKDGQAVYKLTRDSRITPIGAILRRSSLDELPQLFNVLKGEMSLVGPRPPIDYEVEKYDLWHRARLIAAKPGITGLWQVNGRNRIPFNEMVRLDLTYAKKWSPWLDLKILLRTPRAIINGAH